METAKNKKMVYLLLFAVAVVWGVILHKVFFKGAEESQSMHQSISEIPLEAYNLYETKPDTFKLVLNYRDPFLDKSEKIEQVEDNKVRTNFELKMSPPPKPTVVWPEIKYNGRIVNPRSKKMVAIMSVNGIESMIEEGQTNAGIKLVKNKQDSILIRWNGLEKYIKQ